jgi:hypothetical protein
MYSMHVCMHVCMRCIGLDVSKCEMYGVCVCIEDGARMKLQDVVMETGFYGALEECRRRG